MKKIGILFVLLLSTSLLFATGNKEQNVPQETISATGKGIQMAMNLAGSIADGVSNSFSVGFMGGYNFMRSGSKNTDNTNLVNPSRGAYLTSALGVLFRACLMLEILFLGLRLLSMNNEGISLNQIVWKIFSVFALYTIIMNLGWIINGISQIFIRIGLFAGTGYIDATSVLRPSVVTDFYTLATSPLEDYIQTYYTMFDTIVDEMTGSVFNFGTWIIPLIKVTISYLGTMFLCVLIRLLLMFIFLLALVEVTITICELWLLIASASIMLPFKVFRYSKFMGDGVFPALFGQCIKLFVLAFLLSISGELFVAASPDVVTKLNNVQKMWQAALDNGGLTVTRALEIVAQTPHVLSMILPVIFVSFLFIYFVMKGPGIVKALIVGQPSMDTHGSTIIRIAGTKLLSSAVRVASGTTIGRILSTPTNKSSHSGIKPSGNSSYSDSMR